MKNKHEFYYLSSEEKKIRLKEIAVVFLKLGTIAFGGPAAHIAMMDDEIVKKRKWIDKDKFLDLLGATNLIPGPNSTELAIHIGYERGGWLGLILAGAAFILPAMFIVLSFAIAYVTYGELPEISGILYGIKPVIIAIVLQALIRLGQTAIKNKLTAIVGAAVIMLSFLGINEILLIFFAGLFMIIVSGKLKFNKPKVLSFIPISAFVGSSGVPQNLQTMRMGLTTVFLSFLKIGSVLYGSGYVLLAFLESEFVTKYNILTRQQLLDAIAVGQFTPGPVFTTATFVGYLIEGIPGAILATVGIFLPAFVFVGLLNPIVPKLRNSKVVSKALDGVNVASWGLMAVVSWKLGVSAIIDLTTATLAAISLFVVFRFKINSAWIVLAGGIAGFALSFII
jgi:chromate transporter